MTEIETPSFWALRVEVSGEEGLSFCLEVPRTVGAPAVIVAIAQYAAVGAGAFLLVERCECGGGCNRGFGRISHSLDVEVRIFPVDESLELSIVYFPALVFEAMHDLGNCLHAAFACAVEQRVIELQLDFPVGVPDGFVYTSGHCCYLICRTARQKRTTA